jgi:catechol-2,3-dioxygenase
MSKIFEQGKNLVKDIETSKQFYQNVDGLEVIDEKIQIPCLEASVFCCKCIDYRGTH